MIKVTTKDNKTVYLNPKYIISVTKMNHSDYATIIEVDYMSEVGTFYVKDKASDIAKKVLE